MKININIYYGRGTICNIYLQHGFLRAMGSGNVDDERDPYAAVEEGGLRGHPAADRHPSHHGRGLTRDVRGFGTLKL